MEKDKRIKELKDKRNEFTYEKRIIPEKARICGSGDRN